MSVHLDEYEALIQLLIGSVIIAFLFQRKDFLSKTRDSVDNSMIITGYELPTPDAWNQKLNTFRKNLMVILAVYGCMILYYCANFHAIESSITLYNGENLITKEFHPSLFGIAVLSFIVSLYQIITIIRPASRMYLKKDTVLPGLLIFYLIIMVMVFIIFILIIPNNQVDDYNFRQCFGTKPWETKGKRIWETIVSSWVLINLLLWIFIYFWIHRRLKVLTYKLTIDHDIIKQLGVEVRLRYVLNEKLSKEQEYFKKRHLKKRAKQELRKVDGYFKTYDEIVRYIGTSKDTLQPASLRKSKEENEKFTNSLNEIINSSSLPNYWKKRLKKSINENPIIDIDRMQSITTIDDENEEKEILGKNADRLCNFGLLEKTASVETWLNKAIRYLKNIFQKTKRIITASFNPLSNITIFIETNPSDQGKM